VFKEIIVVEGSHDQQKLESIYPHVDTIITGGSAISDETLLFIQNAAEERGVILFLDPDFPGKQITNKILAFCKTGDIKLANLERNKAYSKNHKKIGIEHAGREDIEKALSQFVSLNVSKNINLIEMKNLIELKLVQFPESKTRRALVAQKLHIPYCNGKSFLKYVNMMNTSRSQLDEVMK
jgi:ribonuclease M5